MEWLTTQFERRIRLFEALRTLCAERDRFVDWSFSSRKARTLQGLLEQLAKRERQRRAAPLAPSHWRRLDELEKEWTKHERFAVTVGQLLGARFRGEQEPITRQRLARWMAENAIHSIVHRVLFAHEWWLASKNDYEAEKKRAREAYKKAQQRRRLKPHHRARLASLRPLPAVLPFHKGRNEKTRFLYAVAFALQEELPKIESKLRSIRKGNSQTPLRIVCRITEHLTESPVPLSSASRLLAPYF